MEQTRLVSIVEVVTNVFTGFILAMLVWQFIIPEMFPRMAGPTTENMVVTTTFTVVSIGRSYFWRRFFANGFHKLVAGCVKKFWQGN